MELECTNVDQIHLGIIFLVFVSSYALAIFLKMKMKERAKKRDRAIHDL